LKHFFDSVADSLGRPVAGATVTVNVTGNGLASIYSDDGITLTSNPLTTNALGKFDFYAADGRYDLNISGTGFPAVTLTNIEIADVTEQQSPDATWNVKNLVAVGNITSPVLTSSSANSAGSGTLRLAAGDAIEWRNNANTNDVGLTKNTNDSLNYGGTGIQTAAFISTSTNPATTGVLRLASSDAISWRNVANNNEFFLSKTASDQLDLHNFAAGVIGPTNVILWTGGTPTVTAGFNGGSIPGSNGTAAFSVLIGSGTAVSTGTVGLPNATNFWSCYAQNVSRGAVILFSSSTINSASFTNLGTGFTATNWTNSDAIHVYCYGR